MNSKKLITYIYYGIVVVLLLIFMFRTYTIPSDNEVLQKGPASFGIWQSLIYIGVAVIAALGLALVGIIQNPKALLWTVGGAVVMVVLFFIGKSMASDVVPQAMIDEGVTLGAFQFSHAGVWVAGVMIALSIIMAIASSVKTIFDK
ncbi:MAG: uncharacterized membrane protein YjfL (UPF0719 family) [Bacteroidia bacterium]|jgi:uncharacterized membrane protein YjfL (UPF0719 family)